MLGNMGKYRDEKAFVACQSLFKETAKKLISVLQSPQKIILPGAKPYMTCFFSIMPHRLECFIIRRTPLLCQLGR